MEVQTISRQAFSIYITEQELNRRSLSPGDVTAAEAMELVQELTGKRPPAPTRLELFPGRHELLIFVLQSFGKLRYYRFPSCEELIEAALVGAFEDPSSLFLYNGHYILSVWTSKDSPGTLGEYGEELALREGFLSHLYEHGHTLADGCAATALRAAFA